MARFSPVQNAFIAGELSPGMEGRSDTVQYAQGMRRCENFIVQPQGGVIRRTGTRFVSEVADSNDNIRLIPFRVSPELAYVIEASDLLFRYYTNEGLLVSGTPVNDVTVYAHTELEDIMWAQSANVLYLAHPDHYTATLRRDSATAFTFAKLAWNDGKMPMYPANLSATTIAVSGVGPYTLTSSAPLFDHQSGSDGTDIGRVFRINSTTEGWLEITSTTSTTVVTASLVGGAAPGGSATTDWSRGAQSDIEGFRAIAFHEGRLFLAGAVDEPEGIWGSDSGIFDQFTEGGAANEAIFIRVTGQDANTVQWLASARGALLVGTGGNEGKVISTDDEILTNTSAIYKTISSVGSIHTMPIVVDDDVLFVQRDGARIRRMRSTLEEDNVPEDLNVLHDRVLKPGLGHLGVRNITYQQSPDGTLWCPRRTDGQLAGCTLEKQTGIVAWHRHILGGTSTVDGEPARVVSAAVIPNPTGAEDQLWLCVRRLINGSTVRYVEFVEDKYLPILELDALDNPTIESATLAVERSFFLDCALAVNNPLTITDITEANPAVVTSTSHGLSNGNRVRITEVNGLLDSDGNSRVNFHEFLVANVTANTFELTDLAGNNIDLSTNATAYINGGFARLMFTSVSGLSHLEGETVTILADGAPHPDEVVASGAITLDYPVAVARVGLRFISKGETQRLAGGGTRGTDESRFIRTPRVGVRVDNAAALELACGPLQEEAWQSVSFRENIEWFHNNPPPLYSGDKEDAINSAWARGRTIKFRVSAPLPLTMLALYPHAESHDR